MNKNTPILVLAAGSSSRLGRPKQLLPYKGTWLLKYIIQECVASDVGEVFVVLGANQEEIESGLHNEECKTIINPDWKQGMSTSIAVGVTLLHSPEMEGVYIVLADQPRFTRKVLLDIRSKHSQSGKPIIVSKYGVANGPPCYFDQSKLRDLCQLRGDEGAKAIVQKYSDQVAYIDFEGGDFDVDVEEDVQQLQD